MSVEFIALGTCGGYPRPKRACSGYLIRSSKSNLLLDIGNGVLSNLQTFIQFYEVSAIALSHMHPDHYADIFSIFTAIRFFPVELEPITVLAPAGAFDFIRPALSLEARESFFKVFRWIEWEETDGREGEKGAPTNKEREESGGCGKMANLNESCGVGRSADGPDYIEYTYESPLRISGFDILPAKVNHSINTLGYRIEVEGRVIAYSGDSDICDALIEIGKDADLFICEATFTHQVHEKGGGHLFASEAGRIAAAAKAKRLIITHIWPLFDEDVAVVEAGKEFGGGVERAFEGMRITF